MAHTHTAHFVDIQSRRLFGVAGMYVGETGFGIHFSHLLKEILQHFFVVVVIIHINVYLRDAPFVFAVAIQGEGTFFFGNGFPHHM